MSIEFDPYPLATRRREEKLAAERQARIDAEIARQQSAQVKADALARFLKAEQAQPAVKEPGSFAKYAPYAVRGLGAIAAGTKVPIGMAAGGVADLAAQGIEMATGQRESFSPIEAGAAAVVGGMGSKMAAAVGPVMFEPLRAAKAALPWAVAQPIAHSAITKGEMPEAGDVATSAAFGAGAAGGMSMLLKRFLGVKTPPVPEQPAATGQATMRDAAGNVVKTWDHPLDVRPTPTTQQANPQTMASTVTDLFNKKYGTAAQKAAAAQQAATKTAFDDPRVVASRIEAERRATEKAMAAEQKADESWFRQQGNDYEDARAIEEIQELIKSSTSADEIAELEELLNYYATRNRAAEIAPPPMPPPPDGWVPPGSRTPGLLSSADELLARSRAARARAAEPFSPDTPDPPIPPGGGDGPGGPPVPPAGPTRPPRQLSFPGLGRVKRTPQAADEVVEAGGSGEGQLSLLDLLTGRRRNRNRVLAGTPAVNVASTPDAPVIPPIERRVGDVRLGEEFRGADAKTIMEEIARRRQTPDAVLAGRNVARAPEEIAELEAAIAQAEAAGDIQAVNNLRQRLELASGASPGLSGDEVVAGAERMRAGFAARAGKGFETPRGGTVAPEGAVDAPSSPADALTPDGAGQRLTPEEWAAIDAAAAPEPIPPQIAAEGAEPVNLFKSRVDASGQHYRNLQKALKAGNQDVRPDSARLAGMALQTEARAAGLPVRSGPPTRVAGVADQAAKEQSSVAAIQRMLKGEGGRTVPAGVPGGKPPVGGSGLPPGRRRSFAGGGPTNIGFGNETGSAAVDPLMVNLGMAATGAAMGAALDPMEDRMLSAVLGGAAGAAVPSAIVKIGHLAQLAQTTASLSDTARDFVTRIASPAGFGQEIKAAWSQLPNFIRFNMLSSVNLPANAFAAPYGSGITFALERHLAGDIRGTRALELIGTPDNWAKGYSESWETAKQLISNSNERAAGVALGGATTPTQAVLATPGTMMTAGDLTTRRLLTMAGFSDDEARMATLTAEPELDFFKSLANVQRSGGTAMQALLPFAKTIANVGEQGLYRLPLIGSLAQSARKQADPASLQLIQQGLGLAAGGIGGAAGYYGAGLEEGPMGSSPTLGNQMLRGLVSNSAGAYSLPTSIGYAVGGALRKGKDDLVGAGITEGLQNLPLPSIDLPLSQYRAIRDTFGGDPKLPNGLTPSIIRTIMRESEETGGAPRARRSSRKEKRKQRDRD